MIVAAGTQTPVAAMESRANSMSPCSPFGDQGLLTDMRVLEHSWSNLQKFLMQDSLME